MTETLVNKIRKLLALGSDRNPNTNEREQAMAKAQELIKENNLSMTTIEIDEKTAGTTQSESLEIRLEPFTVSTLFATTKLYHCDWYQIWKTSRSRKTGKLTEYRAPVIVGTSENIGVCLEMSAWLLRSINQEALRRFDTARIRKDFKLGAAHAILKRANDLTKQEEVAQPLAGTQLMVIRNKFALANQSYMDKLNLAKGRKSRGYTLSDGGAYEAGKQFGAKVELSKGAQPKRIS